MKKVMIADIESDGLHYDCKNLWCIWLFSPDKKEQIGFRPEEWEHAIKYMENNVDVLVFHNGIDFDVPVIKKFYPNFKCPKVFDTLVLSRMLEPDRPSHSLESYGVQFGNLKGNFGENNEWDKFTEEMYEYNRQDTDLGTDVYNYLCNRAGFDPEDPPAYEVLR